MTQEQPYLNREIDEFMDDIQSSLNRIEVQTTATNGKVRKIIVALVLLGGVAIGQAFTSTHDIIVFIASLVH